MSVKCCCRVLHNSKNCHTFAVKNKNINNFKKHLDYVS